MRIVPWGTTIETISGLEEFRRGAFDGVNPADVLLMGMEHRAQLGLGQDGRPVLTRTPVGRGTAIEQNEDAAYLTVRVAGTSEGDDVLALAAEKLVKGVSVEFEEVPGGTVTERRNGRRVKVHNRVALRGVSTTHRPAYAAAEVLAVRSEGAAPVSETTEIIQEEVPVTAPAPAPDLSGLTKSVDRLAEMFEKQEERFRSGFSIPATAELPKPRLGEWADIALKILSGERIPDSQFRTVADVISTDNAGVVPDAYSPELIGVIDPRRPFLSSTRRIPTPAAGMSLVVPVINTRPTTAEQTTEKTELSSTATNIGTKSFDMVTIGGVGDISLQLLKRADRSFLELYISLLAEAYAIDCDAMALRALFDAAGGVGAGTALDPEDLSLGDAFAASFDAVRRPPDTIWLSTEAISAFIDAKSDGTNAPLYSNLTSNITAGGGAMGSISGLRAVHTPALDTHGAFALVGPGMGFAWAEDGTYTLQVDVPSKAGRDVALVGMLWFAPWYPDAFSIFNVAS